MLFVHPGASVIFISHESPVPVPPSLYRIAGPLASARGRRGRPMRIQLNRRLKMDNVFCSTDSTTFTSGIKKEAT